MRRRLGSGNPCRRFVSHAMSISIMKLRRLRCLARTRRGRLARARCRTRPATASDFLTHQIPDHFRHRM
jgi:hypothetical protein